MKNYHTHTKRCKHAINTEEEYIQAAIAAGFSELGFSDHTPWHYDSDFIGEIRMHESELDDYVSTLLELREKYKKQISIKIGLECEYFKKYMPWLKMILKKYPIDYIILGNHFNGSDETGIYFGHKLTKQQLTQYVDSCIEAFSTGLYSYLAHPDLANYDTQDSFYQQEMTRLCKAAKDYEIPLEYNLLGYSTYRHYPNDVFFSIAKQVGNQVIIGVDAHDAKSLLDKKSYDEAVLYLQQLGLNIIDRISFLEK